MIGVLGLVALLTLSQNPTAYPPIVRTDPHLHTSAYDPGQVFRLRVPVGFQTTVVLDPSEAIESVAIGDAAAWQVTASERGDLLFIKPLQTGSLTNLTVVTDLRIYAFEIVATSSPTPDSPYTLRFTYPETNSAPAPSTAAPAPVTRRYRLSGHTDARPVAVTDDGARTMITWRPDQSLPAVFALDDRRREVLVNGHMRDGMYVIDATYPTLIFRSDRRLARAHRQPAGGER